MGSPVTINPEDSGEESMPHEHIAQLATATVVVLIVVALPLLDFIGPPCVRFLQRRRNQEGSNESACTAFSSGTLAE